MKYVKINNKGFLVFLVLTVIFSVGYPFYSKYHLRPKKWKKELLNRSIMEFSNNVDKAKIVKFCDCVYDYFSDKYGNVDNFPDKTKYSNGDKIAIIRCTAYNLVNDTTEQKNILKKIDSIK
jgi:hypothetical protein